MPDRRRISTAFIRDLTEQQAWPPLWSTSPSHDVVTTDRYAVLEPRLTTALEDEGAFVAVIVVD